MMTDMGNDLAPNAPLLPYLVAATAHRIRNPLAGASATLQVLQTKLPVNSPYHHQLEVISNELDRAAEVVNELVMLLPEGGAGSQADLAIALAQGALPDTDLTKAQQPAQVPLAFERLTALIRLIVKQLGPTEVVMAVQGLQTVVTFTSKEGAALPDLVLGTGQALLRGCGGTLLQKDGSLVITLPLVRDNKEG